MEKLIPVITYKYKQGTKSRYGHTKVFLDGAYVGMFRKISDNWVYAGTCNGETVNMTTPKRKDLIKIIESLYPLFTK